MDRWINRRALLALAAIGAAWPALAAEAHPEIHLVDGWTRPTGAHLPAVGYLTISNTGGAADRLIAAESPLAHSVTLHQSQMSNGVMRMSPIDGVAVRPGATVVFAPGGLHLMIEGLRGPLMPGERVPVALSFFKSGVLRTQLEVRSAAPAGSPTGR
jgi:copper(I)-binding protein